ncbi:MarC family NAAT transporter [Luteolibacter sp. AS25]|uniref:MarC family NAAT transporter n=1 Tax=Luteolibacter sp. AS25 TaxID=3135776 RepID=UPI00398BB279
MEITVFLTTFAALIAICNPLGNAAIFLSITDGEKSGERHAQATRGCIYMLLILLAFFFCGQAIMSFFGLSLQGIRIAGGLVIVKIGFGLLTPETKDTHTDEEHEEALDKPDISFSPLAMPLLSGPGAIATVIGLSANSGGRYWAYSQMIMAIFAVVMICWVILINSERLLGFLGVNGANALTKIMGFILLCIGVQLCINGVLELVSK